MINIRNVQNYCRDDISLIENYKEAINSTEIYDCHHRLEIDLNLTPKELIDIRRYYNVPADELIFLTHNEHTKLHNINKVESEETRMKKSIANRHKKTKETRKNMSLAKLGKHKVYDENGKFHYE